MLAEELSEMDDIGTSTDVLEVAMYKGFATRERARSETLCAIDMSNDTTDSENKVKQREIVNR